MSSQVSLETKRVAASVVAEAARIRPLFGVDAHVTSQFGLFHGRVVALRTLLWLLLRVSTVYSSHI